MVRDKGSNRRGERNCRWWQDAVAETLRGLKALSATRMRRGGENSERRAGNMVADVVTHDAKRALDPQLHTHVCIMNGTYDTLHATAA